MNERDGLDGIAVTRAECDRLREEQADLISKVEIMSTRWKDEPARFRPTEMVQLARLTARLSFIVARIELLGS